MKLSWAGSSSKICNKFYIHLSNSNVVYEKNKLCLICSLFFAAIILPPNRTISFQSAGASVSHLTLHLAFCLFDLVKSAAVNHNIYLLFFPGHCCHTWSILILVFCLLWPGRTSAERHLEVTAMADYVPFLGVEDLREILTAVLHRKARTLEECRPLKVTHYLQVRNLQI